MFNNTNQNASSAVYVPCADVVLLAGEQEQRAERQQHRQNDEYAAEHRANDVAIEQVHAAAAAGATAAPCCGDNAARASQRGA